MENNENFEARNLLAKLVEAEEEYHGKKERLAWTASSVYFTFSVILLAWLFKNSLGGHKIVSTLLLSVIYFGLISFVSLQFRGRWDCLIRESAYNSLLFSIEPFHDPVDIAFRIKKAKEIECGKKINRRCLQHLVGFTICLVFFPIWVTILLFDLRRCPEQRLIASAYKSEIPTYAIITAFFIGQLILVWN